MSATPRQRDLVDTLLRERAVPEGVQATVVEIMGRADADPSREGPISRIITQLMAMPRRPREAAAPAAAGVGFWDGIEKAKYALPVAALDMDAARHAGGNDHLFVEVKEWKGTTYMRQLHGAPGSFSRTKMRSAAVTQAIRAIRAEGALAGTQRFGTLYTCCGVCGAELTDERSRELKLGPVCRTRFGF